MHAALFPAIDTDLPGLLRCLRHQFEMADDAGAAATLAALGAGRIGAAPTLVGALCIGGAAFAARLLATQRDGLSADACTAELLDAFHHITTTPDDAAPDHLLRTAEWLVDGFALPVSGAALFDIVQAEFLIDRGPLSELPVAVQAAMTQERWALSLRGLQRQRQALQQRTPRRSYGLAAMCLHRLGRYDEADAWVHDGLGDAKSLINIPPVHTEQALLARWGGARAPVVSIICTAYNHQRYIESALRGFMSQDCDFPFEVLIHDDALTDRTQDVIRRWQQRYPTVIKPVLQTVNQLSQGVRPLELLLGQARGEFVATCEGDDFWIRADKLQRQVNVLRAEPQVHSVAHNYHHVVESMVTVKPWRAPRQDFYVTPRSLMAVKLLLWLPTLMFRRSFTALPPERNLSATGDYFLTSYLGSLGKAAYLETFIGAVRRENPFSSWTPLPEAEKERRRVQNFSALIKLHQRLGNVQAVTDLLARIRDAGLDGQAKASIVGELANFQPTAAVEA